MNRVKELLHMTLRKTKLSAVLSKCYRNSIKSTCMNLLLFASSTSFAQEMDSIANFLEDLPAEEVDQPFTIVEQTAYFPGGPNAFSAFLIENIQYPQKAMRLRVEGKVYVQFVVNEEGKVEDLAVVKGIGAGCDEEAVRVLSLMPDWIPAEQRGRKVKQKMVQAITFVLPAVFFSVDDAIDFNSEALGLNIAGNNLSELDIRIRQLANLEMINIQDNQIRDLSLLSELPLREIYAADNEIESLPPSFAQLKQLLLLSLSGNKLRSLPSPILEIKKIEVLDLSFNNIESLPEELADLKKLRVLSIQGNELITSLPRTVTKLKNLEALLVGATSISESELEKLKMKLPELRIIKEIEE